MDKVFIVVSPHKTFRVMGCKDDMEAMKAVRDKYSSRMTIMSVIDITKTTDIYVVQDDSNLIWRCKGLCAIYKHQLCRGVKEGEDFNILCPVEIAKGGKDSH